MRGYIGWRDMSENSRSLAIRERKKIGCVMKWRMRIPGLEFTKCYNYFRGD